MVQRVQAKANAKAQLKGKWGTAIGALLLGELVVAVAAALVLIPLIGAIAFSGIAAAITLGFAKFSLKFANGEKPTVGVIFSGFESFLKAWGLTIVTAIFTLLWSLLLYVPGIIKAISYSMAMYVLAENPEVGVMEALKRSKEMTKGHKGQLFVTYLSFIGWSIVCSFTLGIGYLWLIPYMQVTMANIYNQLKGESVQVGEAGVAL